MDFAAGDSCFYIGLGNTKTNSPTFEPYQCCPKPSQPQTANEKPESKKDKSGKSARKETKDDVLNANGKPDNYNKKKEKRNKKDNGGKASWWW